jgi:DNA-binding transcriptional regulator GbsR (MarR family)
MDRATASLVEGLGVAAATSGILTQQQARIFALLYLEARPLSLDEIAAALEQSKSNVSIQIRGLVEWHLVRRKPVPGSRKDHYEAATDFFRAMQEIFERRFRWIVRQVLAAVAEAKREAEAGGAGSRAGRERLELLRARLAALGEFFALVDHGIGLFAQGQDFPAAPLRNVVTLDPAARRTR